MKKFNNQSLQINSKRIVCQFTPCLNKSSAILSLVFIIFFIGIVNAGVYEFDVTNSSEIISMNELNYNHYNSTSVDYELYVSDNYIGNATFTGDFIYNDGDGYFWGSTILNNETTLPENISNSYNGICIMDNYLVSCLLTNTDSWNSETYIVSGVMSADYSKIILIGYEKFNSATGNTFFNITGMYGNINFFLNDWLLAGYGNDMTIYNTKINNSNFKGLCYQINNETLGISMENIKCAGILNSYIDYDNDGFTSEIDCNDNDYLINKNATEINDNSIDENCDGILGYSPVNNGGGSSGGSGGSSGHFSNHTPQPFVVDWNSRYNKIPEVVPLIPEVKEPVSEEPKITIEEPKNNNIILYIIFLISFIGFIYLVTDYILKKKKARKEFEEKMEGGNNGNENRGNIIQNKKSKNK